MEATLPFQTQIEQFIANNPYWTLLDIEDERNSRFILGVVWHYSKIGGTTYVEFDGSRMKEDQIRSMIRAKALESRRSITELREEIVRSNLWEGQYGRWISMLPSQT